MLSKLLFDLNFDGHAMAIPSWYITRIEACHLAAFHDHVLQNLVDRMADMNIAIGIGRPIMQNPDGTAFGLHP